MRVWVKFLLSHLALAGFLFSSSTSEDSKLIAIAILCGAYMIADEIGELDGKK